MCKKRDIQDSCSRREVDVRSGGQKERDHKALVGQEDHSGLYSKEKREPLLGFIQGNNNGFAFIKTESSCSMGWRLEK